METSNPIPVSVLVLTKNEEVNIERCLDSVRWSDDIVVFDSYSEDRTVELSRQMDARVEQRAFDNYASQRNAALNLDLKHDWVLFVDADEGVSSELKNEIAVTLANVHDSIAMFQMRRKDYFCGRWIKHASAYPTWFGRLIRKGAVQVEREINEEYHASGEIRKLQEHLVHFPFSKGIAFWFERHNQYSTMEASALIDEVAEPFRFRALWASEPTARRKAHKQLAYRLPARPVLVFVFLYIMRLGFLDGIPGFRFCIMRSMYECMIDLKVAELRYKVKKGTSA